MQFLSDRQGVPPWLSVYSLTCQPVSLLNFVMIHGHHARICFMRFTLRYFQIVELLVNYPEREMKHIVEETLTDEETEDPH